MKKKKKKKDQEKTQGYQLSRQAKTANSKCMGRIPQRK